MELNVFVRKRGFIKLIIVVYFVAICGGTLSSMGGVILSLGFLGAYFNNLDCTWKVALFIGYGKRKYF